MPKRFLNVEYGTISTEIDVTDFEDLSDVQDAIKSEYGPAMADIDAPHPTLHQQKACFWQILDSSSTFYIVDGSAPVDVDAKTILVTLPRWEIWHQFSKGPATFEQQDFLDKALNISNIDSVVKSFGKYGENLDASSCLIHISVKDGFHSGPYQFASDYVVDEIYNRVYARDRDHLIRFVSVTREIGGTGQLNRALFEKHAHTVIAKGGSFKIRDLRTKLESTLQLPMDLSTLLFSTILKFKTQRIAISVPLAILLNLLIRSSSQIYFSK
ncbi:hypothetical protein BSLG_005882 [Batrachochytrium salamandrivorans]|nr:hypothetical protein BSLG_005882 [Batrachochytrium salamandrivorans]